MFIKRLSEKLSAFRTDRPDEWMMDEFKRDAVKLEAERDEALAKRDKLRKWLSSERRLSRELKKDMDSANAKLAAMESLDDVLVDAVDDLGHWLCRDMEKEAAKSCRFTEKSTIYAVIADVAKRIRFYRENCLKYSLGNRAMRAKENKNEIS